MAQCLIRPGSGPKRRSTLPTSLPATCSVKCLNGRHLSVDVATIDGLCCRVPPPYRVPARPEGDAEPSQAPFLLPHFLPSPSRSLPPRSLLLAARPPWLADQQAPRPATSGPSRGLQPNSAGPELGLATAETGHCCRPGRPSTLGAAAVGQAAG